MEALKVSLCVLNRIMRNRERQPAGAGLGTTWWADAVPR